MVLNSWFKSGIVLGLLIWAIRPFSGRNRYKIRFDSGTCTGIGMETNPGSLLGHIVTIRPEIGS